MSAGIEARWRVPLLELCAQIRTAARAAIGSAIERDDWSEVSEPVRHGAGDVTYGVDDVVEQRIDAWLEERARERPLSLLTEDRGWLHRGPGANGRAVALGGFDHGGPRIALDPIDGTRNLMADLRSAWTVVSCACPGSAVPRLSELELGIVSEIPDSRAARFRTLTAARDAPCTIELFELSGEHLIDRRDLRVDGDDRVDRGFFPFFRYAPEQRPALARIEATFFERLERLEGADLRHVFDDQYISNAGQIVQLALGRYRMIADLRAWLARRSGRATVTSKPYDVAGAILCARAAGCTISGPLGTELDFPLDATTPVDFIGFANRASALRMRPHLDAALVSAD
jgi:fructose-1,6-bisphosphatase/inositol monophosphatase family enzyme